MQNKHGSVTQVLRRRGQLRSAGCLRRSGPLEAGDSQQLLEPRAGFWLVLSAGWPSPFWMSHPGADWSRLNGLEALGSHLINPEEQL